MSVNVPAGGKRGVPFPKFFARLGNRMMVGRFGRGGARTGGGIATLVLETIGAKSGSIRPVLLGYLAEGDSAWLVMASLAGAARNPAWLHNLAAHPDATAVFDGDRRVDVRAESVAGDELTAAWERIAREAPEYDAYRSKTDREIAVVRLRRR